MATNVGFDDGHPYAEEGADEGVVVQDGSRHVVVLKGEETSQPLGVTIAGGVVSVEVPAATLTPFPDMGPVPRVLVDVPTLAFPSGSVTVSLTRTAEGRTFDVRGGQKLPASSPVIVVDAEAPFGVESSYTVMGYDADGAVVGSWPVGTVTLEYEGTVIQQPLDPRLSVQVQLLGGTASELVRPTPGEPAYPQGRTLPGVVGLGPRRGLQGLSIQIETETPADAVMLDATLGTYETPQLPIWLIRTVPDGHLPRVLFCHVPELVKHDTYLATDYGQAHFSATVTEVTPPAAGITAAALAHSDMKVFFSTHTEVKAQYGTHSDIKRDTSLIGASDA